MNSTLTEFLLNVGGKTNHWHTSYPLRQQVFLARLTVVGVGFGLACLLRFLYLVLQ